MDKTLIFAVAGAGKTTEIVNRLDPAKRTLIFTYTEENLLNLRRKLVETHGAVPERAHVMTYFRFLHSFCYRPLAGFERRARGINFDDKPPPRVKETSRRYYMDGAGRLYACRIAKALTNYYGADAIARVEHFFDAVFVDEVQDFAAHDFNFLLSLGRARVDMLMVGDFLQHTYDTSRDGSTRRSLHKDYARYRKEFAKAGFRVDIESLSHSRRCSPAVCEFITRELGVEIRTRSTASAKIVTVESQDVADALRARDDVVKLFYQEHRRYDCHSQNWGASKGEDHHNEVCVVLPASAFSKHLAGKLSSLAPQSLNKLYVALSRSRGDVHLAPETFFQPGACRAN